MDKISLAANNKKRLFIALRVLGAVLVITAFTAKISDYAAWVTKRSAYLLCGVLLFSIWVYSRVRSKLPLILKAAWNNLKGQIWLLPVYCLVLVSTIWFVTNGTWKVFEIQPAGYMTHYDYLGDSLLRGRLDIPLYAIKGEDFNMYGKIYSYFGIGPALLRIPLNFFFPSLWGLWSRFFIILACLLNLVITQKIFSVLFDRFNKGQKPHSIFYTTVQGIFLLAVGFGSTNILMASHASVYNEAVALAASFSLLSFYSLYRYLDGQKSTGWLFTALISAFFALFSRITSGFGPLVGLTVILALAGLQFLPWVKTQRSLDWMVHFQISKLHLGLITITLLGIVLLEGWINYSKFGSPFDVMPSQYQSPYINNPARLARIQGQNFHISNTPYSISKYLLPGSIQVDWSFPPILLTSPTGSLQKKAFIDLNKPVSAASVSSTFLILAAAAGLWSGFKNWRQVPNLFVIILVSGGFLVGFATILTFSSFQQRYMHDLFAPLVFLSALGITQILSGVQNFATVYKAGVIGFFGLLVMFNAWECISFTYRTQLDEYLIPIERQVQLLSISRSVDSRLGIKQDPVNMFMGNKRHRSNK